MWFLEENPDVGAGGENNHRFLSLSSASVVSPSESFSRGSLCLPLCLQPGGVPYFENKHWDVLWELKDPVMRKDWSGFLFVMGTLSCPHLGEKVGRGLEASRNGPAGSEVP